MRLSLDDSIDATMSCSGGDVTVATSVASPGAVAGARPTDLDAALPARAWCSSDAA